MRGEPGKIQWSREESKERFPYPISPLGWSLLKAPTEVSLQALSLHLGIRNPKFEEVVTNINGYVYTQKHYFQNHFIGKLRLKAILKFGWLIGKAMVSTTKDLFLNRNAPIAYRIPLLNWFFALPGILQKTRRFSGLEIYNPYFSLIEELVVYKFLAASVVVLLEWNQQKNELISLLKEKKPIPSSLTLSEFVAIRNSMQVASCRFFLHDFNVYFLKNLIFQWLVFRLQLGGLSFKKANDYLATAIKGLKGNFSVNAAKDYQSLNFDTWLEKYGHLTDNWDVMAPLLSELPRDLLQKSAHQAKTCFESSRDSLTPEPLSFGPRFARALTLFQELVIADEELRAHSSSQFPEVKKLFATVTQQSYWPQNLSPNDIYFLTLSEIESSLATENFQGHLEKIQHRKAAYHKALMIEPPLDWGTEDEKKEVEENLNQLILTGAPISNGIIVGQALLIRSMEDFSSYAPDKHILVVRSANPTYAPYYTSCLGILSERGGLLSHGAIVARELGLPMIGEINKLFEKIHSGDLLRVDGSLGTIEVLAKSTADDLQTTKVKIDDEYTWKQSSLTF